jgi:transcriptional regulator with XRE-family HTH domain
MPVHVADGPERPAGEVRRTGLIELRAEMKWLQSDVAERSGGLGQTEICRIETGENRLTTVQTIERAARGYGLTVESFRRLCAGELSPKRAAGLVRRGGKG